MGSYSLLKEIEAPSQIQSSQTMLAKDLDNEDD
jgi:hypothetical protein